MRRLSLVGLSLFFILAAGCARDSGGGTEATASLRILGGTVEVQAGGGGFAPANEGQALDAGYTIRTGADGRAEIEYFDGSVTRLDSNTTFTIITLEILDNEDESKVIEGEQESGSTYTRVVALTDSASRFDVVTPTATASVQGTVYAILINPDGTTTVAVVDGQVNVNTIGTPTSVLTGLMVIIQPDGTVGDPIPIPPELLEADWIVFNQCELDGEDCDIDAPGPLASIEISPETADVGAGEAQEYTAIGFDADGDPLGSVDAAYGITDGTCEANACSATGPGDHTVTGSFGGFSDTATLTVGLGAVEIVLEWSGSADLDLWVTDPNGETVRYDTDASTGGHLDDDANKDCEVAAPPPPETIAWPSGSAPLGEYTITVDYWTECGAGAVDFTVTATVNGEVVFSDSGSLAESGGSYEASFSVEAAS